MNEMTSFDVVLSGWLHAAGPHDVPTATVDAALATARRFRQRRGLSAALVTAPWPRAGLGGLLPWPGSLARPGRTVYVLIVLAVLLALLMAAVAGGLIRLPSEPPFARNGLIAYQLDAAAGALGREIHLVNTDGTEQRLLIGSAPAFSSDGSSLAYYASGDRGLTTVASADGRTAAVLPLPHRLAGVARPIFAVSPTGEYVARVFTAAYHDRDQVWLESVKDGSMWRTMTNYQTTLQPGGLTWSPDGRRLFVAVTQSAYASAVPYLASIDSFTVEPRPDATSDPAVLPGGAAPGFVEIGVADRYGPPNSRPSISPDGTLLAFAGYPQAIPLVEKQIGQVPQPSEEMAADIYVVRVAALAADKAEFDVTQTPAHETSPEWAPDASRLAYLQTDGASTRLVTVTMAGSTTTGQALTGPVAEDFEWSPDASLLLAVHYDGATSTVFLVDPEFRSTPRTLVSVRYPISSLSWQRLPP